MQQTMKHIFRLMTLALATMCLTACSDDEETVQEVKLRTSAVEGIDETVATVSGKIESGADAVSEVGICWSKNPDLYDESTVFVPAASPAQEYTVSLGGLKSGTTYYVSSYAKCGENIFFGDLRSFTTLGQLAYTMPFIERFRGEQFLPTFWTMIDADGDGHNWEQYDRFPSVSSDSYSGGALTPNNFIVSPKITISGSKPTLYWSVGCGDSKYPDEYYKVVVSETPFTAANCDNNGTKVFDETLVSEAYRTLLPRQVDLSAFIGKDVYIAWVHCECSDNYFMFFSDVYLEDSSNPIGVKAPEVKIEEASEVTKNSAVVTAVELSDGEATIVNHGFVYATHSNPTIDDEVVKIAAWNELAETKLTDLDNGTTYYVRAYAENKMGITYSNEIQFTTPAVIETVLLDASFLEELPAGWSVLDKDGDGHTWVWEDDSMWSYSYRSSYGGTLTPEDYLISPAITIPENAEQVDLSFTISVYKSYYEEKYRIVVSEEPITLENCQEAEVVRDWTMMTEAHTGLNYQLESADLSAYAGKTIYVAFVHGDCSDNYALVMQSVKVTSYE